MKTIKELATLVAEMRHAQRQYFRSRSQTDLHAAKVKEQAVDKTVKDILSPDSRPLFGGGGEG